MQLAEERDLRGVKRSYRVGSRNSSFPTRGDYVAHLITTGLIKAEDDLLDKPDLVEAVQSNWHQLGLNGCRFAQLLSKKPAEFGWKIVVATGASDEPPVHRVLSDISSEVSTAFADPGTFAVSFIFPDVTTTLSLVRLLSSLGRLPGWRLDETGEPIMTSDSPTLIPVGLRILLGESGLRSWALGFGPFEFLPPTRRAPFTEIALAAKAKAFPLRDERLNPHPLLAHLADVPVPSITDDLFKKLWGSTTSNKSTILAASEEPLRTGARARVTFAVPQVEWDETWLTR